MASLFSLFSVGAILAAAPRGCCQSGEEFITGEAPLGLFDIPTSEYADGDRANATGTITFESFSLSIAVKADVPIPGAEPGDNSTMTSVISLGIDSPATNQTTCVAIYHGLSANISASSIDLDSQDGSGCGQMLTNDCISELLSSVEVGIQGGCPSLPQITSQSCREQFGDMSGSTFSIQPQSEQTLYQHGTSPAAPGNQTLWLAAVTNIWPIFITTIAENGSTSTSETYLNCLRPDTFKEGTVRPSSKPSGTESGGDNSTGTGTTNSTTPSPTSAASHASLTIAVFSVGLFFNAVMLFM